MSRRKTLVLATHNIHKQTEMKFILSRIGVTVIGLDQFPEIKSIEDNSQIALYYCGSLGEVKEDFNPNGSLKNIAGIFNKKKNVLGMMPHPERMIEKYLSGDDGSIFFENLLNNLK